MKKHNKSFVSLLAILFLVGCGSEASNLSDVVSATTADTTSTETATEQPVVSDSSASDSESSESVSVDPQQTYADLWGDDIANLMLAHLNYVVPYIDVGKATAQFTGSNEDYYLEITGYKGKIDITTDDGWLAVFSQYLSEDGWTILANSSMNNGYTATKDELHLKVVLTLDDMSCTIKCYYDEPYDESSATDWSDEVTSKIASDLDGHTIPFFYMGTRSPFIASPVSSSYDFAIVGGVWNDLIASNGKAALESENAGFTVTDAVDDKVVFTATKAFNGDGEDGCVLSLSLQKTSANVGAHASLQVKLIRGYKLSDSNGEWTTELQDAMSEIYGKLAPFFYVGTNSQVFASKSAANCSVKFYGGDYSEEGLESIKTQIEAYTDYTWETTTGTSNSSPKYTLTGTDATTDDTWKIEVSKYKDGRFYVSIEYLEGYQPSKETSWRQGLVDQFVAHTDSHQIPYFYIGTRGNNAWVASSTIDGGTIVATGGKWNDALFDNIKTALEADTNATWTITTNDKENKKFVASAKYTDGCEFSNLQVTCGNSNHISLQATFVNKMTTSETAWSSSVQKYITDKFKGHELPFVYLNKANATAGFSASTNVLTITGGNIRDEVYTNFTSTYTEAGWEPTETTKNDKKAIYAEKEFEDGCVIQVTLYQLASQSSYNSYSAPVFKLEAKYISAYDPNDATEWTYDTKKKMTDTFGQVFPYVYLGNDPTVTVDNSTSDTARPTISFVGGSWSDKVYDAFDKAFETENADLSKSEKWTVRADTVSKKTYHVATQKKDDGSETRIALCPSKNDDEKSDGVINMTIYNWDAPSYPSKTAYDDYVLEAMKNVLPADRLLPYIYIGSNANIHLVKSSSNSMRLMVYDSINWSNDYIYNAKTVLENDGYTVEVTDMYFYKNAGNVSKAGLVAEKTYADGAKTIVRFSQGNLGFTYFSAVPETTTGAWSEELQSSMKENLNGNVIPYLYLGDTDAQTVGDWTSSSMAKWNIVTYDYNDDMYESIKTTLLADTERNWSGGYDYSSGSKKLVMSCEDPNSKGHHITVTFQDAEKDNYYLYQHTGTLTFYYN